MANRRLYVDLILNQHGFRTGMGAAAVETERFGKSVDHADTSVRRLKDGAKVGAVAVAVAIGAAAKAAADFEKQMRNVNTVAGLSEERLAATGRQVLDLSRQVPQSASVLAQGLYDIASSGFQGADGLTVLRTSAAAASAGLTDTATAANAITAVLNAYSQGADHAADVSDTLFQTVNLGVINFEELSRQVGFFVGQGRALRIPFDQLAAALAAMTLNGIQADQSGTVLGATLNALIKPSDGMSQALHRLGYETGSQAVQALGLRGTLEGLARVTGGTAEGMSALFQDTVALRGALAATAGDSAKYETAAAGIENQQARQGSTTRALAEQSKALTFQLGLLRNEAVDLGIAAASHLLPHLTALAEELRNGGNQVERYARAAAHELAPLLHAIGDNLQAELHLVRTLGDVFGPVVAGAAALAATGLVEFLTALASATASATEFLADHQAVVTVLAVLYAARLGPSVFFVARLFRELIKLRVAEFFTGVATGTKAAAGAMVAFEAIATAGIAVAAAVAGAAIHSWREAGKEADRFTARTLQQMNALDPASVAKTTAVLDGAVNAAVKRGRQYAGLSGTFRAGIDAAFGDADDVARKGVAALHALDEIPQRVNTARLNLARLSLETGVPMKDLSKLAIGLKIDLSDTGDKGEAALARLRASAARLTAATHTSAATLTHFAGSSTAALDKLKQDLIDVQDRARQAMANATDAITHFDPSKGGLARFYRDTVKQTKGFAADLQTAARKGIDPSYLARLIEAGPQQAAPILRAIATDHSGRLVQLVNSSERALRKINARVVEYARLTHLAVIGQTDRLGVDLDRAMRIADAKLQLGSKATAAAIGRLLHLPPKDVQRIADEFGITLTQLQTTADKHPIKVTVKFVADQNLGLVPLHGTAPSSGWKGLFPGVDGHADGGLIRGPGGPRDDRVLARLSDGEFVVRAAAVQRIGVETLERLNRYADGGLVKRGASAPVIVRVPAAGGAGTSHRYDFTGMTVQPHDFDGFMREMDRRARFAAVTGGVL